MASPSIAPLKTPRFRLNLTLCVTALFLLAGCGTYRNMTAYFNTYYNASHLFDQAVLELEKAPQPARDSNYFAPFKTPPGTIKKFESVIEKGSKLIQFHGESGYVEDAILMIGKSYLYQNETESASRKFKELLDNFRESDKIPEAKLWYAKALYMGKNDEEALVAVKELTAAGQAQDGGADVDDDFLLEGLMLEAQIYADRGETDIAARTLSRIGTLDGDGRLKAIAQYQLGTVYEQTGSYTESAAAFGLVDEYSPSPDMSFNAKLRRGVMLTSAGRPEEALESFDEIIALPLKKEQSALVDLEIANTYWSMGDSAAAFILYDIIDSTYKKTDASARAYFKRGDIHEHDYLDLKKARQYYDKARKEFPASRITTEAGYRFTSLDHYFKTHASLAKDDSLFTVALHTDSAGNVVLPEGFAGATHRDSAGVLQPEATDGSGEETADLGLSEGTVQNGQLQRIETLSMRVLRGIPRHFILDPEEQGVERDTPPERDLAQVTGTPPAKAGTGGKGAGGPAGKPAGKGGKGQEKAKPKEPLSPEKLEAKIVASEYELGGILFLDLNLPDSALLYYGTIVRDHPESPLVPKAMYAMSEVHRTLGDTAVVDSLYDVLLADYPATEYAEQVRRTRGLDTTGSVDSPAMASYRRAEQMLLDGQTDSALSGFKMLYAATSDSVIRPKACYAVGWILENVRFELDSADAWYKKLLKEYPSSVYAGSAEPRVAVKGDTSKLKTYVKFDEIKPIAKPKRNILGLIKKEGAAAGQPVPGSLNQADDEDDYYDPDKDIDPDDEIDEEDEEDPPEEDEDDPGRAWFDAGTGRLFR